jgi:hypothetical protein
MMDAMALDRALGQGLGIKGEHDIRAIPAGLIRRPLRKAADPPPIFA